MGTRTGHLIIGTLGVFLFMHPAWALQETPRQDVFEDALRADSLMRQITPDRLEAFRQKAQRESEPRNWYDLGSALLLTGDWEGAVEPLQRAAAAADRRVDEPSASRH